MVSARYGEIVLLLGQIFIVGSRERKGEVEDEYEWMNEYEYLC